MSDTMAPPTTTDLHPEAIALHAAAQRLIASRQNLIDEPCSAQRPALSPAELSELTRQWLGALLETLFPPALHERCVFYELGSLARDEICLHSDIDLLIEVHDEALLREQVLLDAITALMNAARTLRLKLKHVVRTPSQHAEEFERDWRTPTALLDARPLPQDAATKAALIEAGVEVRMSKAGVELLPGAGFDAAKLEGL